MLRHYWKTLIAVLGGNFLYFAILEPHLPPAGRHTSYQFDWGLIVDLWVCVAIYGLLSVFKPRRK